MSPHTTYIRVHLEPPAGRSEWGGNIGLHKLISFPYAG